MARPPPAAPAPVRLRLLFDNSRLLRRAHRDEGLRRCWLLLSPELATVADLAAHVAARFCLRRTCPEGVVLSMDGFTLPPFESTCIFRDNDTKVGHNDVHCLQDREIIEKRPLPVDDKILAIEDQKDGCKHQEEMAHDDHQLEENATASLNIKHNVTCSKRKWNVGVAEIPESSKCREKRLKVAKSGKHIDHNKEEQSGSKKLKSPVIDIEAKKATPQHETTTTLVEQQKNRGNDCKHQEEMAHDDHQLEENATASLSIKNNVTCSKRKWNAGVAEIPESSKCREKRLKVAKSGKQDHNKEEQSGSKKLKSPVIDIEAKKATPQHETTTTLVEQKKTEGNKQTELTCEAKVADYNAQSDTKKLGSRSTRRKKIKRLLRQRGELETEKNVHEDSPIAADFPSSSNQDGLPVPSSNQNGSHVHFSSLKADEEESDTSEEIVPVVVRPGHIRFEPAGGSDKSPAKELQDTFQWNGTMSKKKGQKWGLDSSNKKNADIVCHAGIAGSSTEASNHVMAGSSTEVSNHVMDIKVTENGSCAVSNRRNNEGSKIEISSVKTVANEEKSNGEPFDFESLYPLMRLPKEGDLIAYRLVELSSMLCPELSPYRVGKVLIYDIISSRIILLPVQEYPIITEEKENKDESDMLVDLSPYKEDGSLEIEYSSLLDVRLLKGVEPVLGAASTPTAETCNEIGSALAGRPATLHKNGDNIESQKPPLVSDNTKEEGRTLGKSEATVWEKNDEPSDKVDVQENGWGEWKQNASTSAWSYRALRSSALGPTMAMLRGKNSQRGGKPPYRKDGK